MRSLSLLPFDIQIVICKQFCGDTNAAHLSRTSSSWKIAVEEWSRLWILKCSVDVRKWVPRRQILDRYESWLSLVHEVNQLQKPLVFSRAHDNLIMDKAMVRRRVSGIAEFSQGAMSNTNMRAGRHCAHFTSYSGDYHQFGIVRPDWNVSLVDAELIHDHWFYYMETGYVTNQSKWDGYLSANEGDVISLLLDFDEGTLTAFKNKVLLGTIASGLTGEYCWSTSFTRENGCDIEDDNCVEISKHLESWTCGSCMILYDFIPDHPTAEELLEAKERSIEEWNS